MQGESGASKAIARAQCALRQAATASENGLPTTCAHDLTEAIREIREARKIVFALVRAKRGGDQ